MTSYQTCRGCAVDRNLCKTRQTVRSGIKGLGITSVKFKCADRKPFFESGDRVSVTWNIPNPDDCGPYGEYSWDKHTWPATVIQEAWDGKYVVLVDDVDSDIDKPAREWITKDNLFCKVRVSRLALLDEPRRDICTSCKEPFGDHGACISSYCNEIRKYS